MSGRPQARCPLPREVKVRDELYVVPCGSRYCAVCGRRWEQDQRVRAVAASEHLGGGVALLTVTAPGNAWFAEAAADGGHTRREEIRHWNATARARWRRLHLRASKEARRWARLHGVAWRLLYRAWEFQRRGLLHVHAVLPWGSWVERTATRRRIHARYGWAATSGAAWRAARMVDAVQRGRPPLTTETQDAIRALSQDRGATLWVDTGDGELRSPTPAPVPLGTPRELPRPPGATRVAVLGLASVRLRDPQAPWLGEFRTVLRRVELIELPTIS